MIELLAGAGLIAGGIVLGRLTVRPRRTGTVVPPRRCSCKHARSSHEHPTGPCHEQVEQANRWDSYGKPTGYVYVPCPCQRYDGPEPMPSTYWPGVEIPPPPS